MNLQDRLLKQPDIWQEYDCPATGIDFDLGGDQIKYMFQAFHCPGCGHDHIATSALISETMVRLDNEELQFRGLPKTAEEKANWIVEVAEATERFNASFPTNPRLNSHTI